MQYTVDTIRVKYELQTRSQTRQYHRRGGVFLKNNVIIDKTSKVVDKKIVYVYISYLSHQMYFDSSYFACQYTLAYACTAVQSQI